MSRLRLASGVLLLWVAVAPAATESPARRIVSVAPHLTELVYTAGAGERMVGADAYSDYPAAARALPRIGDAFQVDYEQVLALHPDLVLVWDSGTPEPVIEKLRSLGLRVERITTSRLEDIATAIRRIGMPCVVKTADFGYDGKGQIKVNDDASVAKAVASFTKQRAVVEKFIEFKCELSVIVARTPGGAMKTFPVSENIHTKHILDFSIVPARITEAVRVEAETLAKTMLALAILFAAVRSPGYAEVPWRGLAGAAAGTCSANPREREHMDAGQFRKRLSTLTGFPRERAELLARTTLVTLSSRISAGEADDLAAHRVEQDYTRMLMQAAAGFRRAPVPPG